MTSSNPDDGFSNSYDGRPTRSTISFGREGQSTPSRTLHGLHLYSPNGGNTEAYQQGRFCEKSWNERLRHPSYHTPLPGTWHQEYDAIRLRFVFYICAWL